MRRLSVGAARIDADAAFTGMRDVLTGLPAPAGGNEK
jgi:hypothetical protein